jgi:hypothetical protein
MAAMQDSRHYRGCDAWDEENKSQIVRRDFSTVLMPRILVFLDTMWCSGVDRYRHFE